MPKIFLIKNRLHQQQQRLLESQNLLQHKNDDDHRLVPPLSSSPPAHNNNNNSNNNNNNSNNNNSDNNGCGDIVGGGGSGGSNGGNCLNPSRPLTPRQPYIPEPQDLPIDGNLTANVANTSASLKALHIARSNSQSPVRILNPLIHQDEPLSLVTNQFSSSPSSFSSSSLSYLGRKRFQRNFHNQQQQQQQYVYDKRDEMPPKDEKENDEGSDYDSTQKDKTKKQ
uniref:Uncharacterized protein n=1 Tax=Glossina pallidipes TaxID=7398 RepID=A0A1B0AHB0_GLOPL